MRSEKEFVEKTLGELDVGFWCTNESLEAIVQGMDVQQGDRILGVMGSGQQGLAMIEKGAKVDLIDKNDIQTEYFYKISLFIKNETNSNESCIKLLKDVSDVRDEKLMNFFDLRKIVEIRKNFEKMNILKSGDIFDLKDDLKKYNKIYLSNAIHFSPGIYSNEKFLNFVNRFNEKTLFYISDSHANKSELENIGFKINSYLTRKARKIDSGWDPQVIIKDNTRINLFKKILKHVRLNV